MTRDQEATAAATRVTIQDRRANAVSHRRGETAGSTAPGHARRAADVEPAACGCGRRREADAPAHRRRDRGARSRHRVARRRRRGPASRHESARESRCGDGGDDSRRCWPGSIARSGEVTSRRRTSRPRRCWRSSRTESRGCPHSTTRGRTCRPRSVWRRMPRRRAGVRCRRRRAPPSDRTSPCRPTAGSAIGSGGSGKRSRLSSRTRRVAAGSMTPSLSCARWPNGRQAQQTLALTASPDTPAPDRTPRASPASPAPPA